MNYALCEAGHLVSGTRCPFDGFLTLSHEQLVSGSRFNRPNNVSNQSEHNTFKAENPTDTDIICSIDFASQSSAFEAAKVNHYGFNVAFQSQIDQKSVHIILDSLPSVDRTTMQITTDALGHASIVQSPDFMPSQLIGTTSLHVTLRTMQDSWTIDAIRFQLSKHATVVAHAKEQLTESFFTGITTILNLMHGLHDIAIQHLESETFTRCNGGDYFVGPACPFDGWPVARSDTNPADICHN